MGKLNMGILGGFSGTVGTVVGSTNKKGDDIIRVKTKRTRTSNTEGQVNQRTKFRLVTGFMQELYRRGNPRNENRCASGSV